MENYLLYGVTILFIIISFYKDRKKTKIALKKAWKAFENILPEFLGIIIMVGIVLAFLNPEVVSKIIGKQSGWPGVLIAAVVGAITLIPGFVAFPMAAMVLQSGAGLMQIGAFVSALMMVGVVTFPVETKYFGKKLALWRNGLAFLFSFLVAFIIEKVVG
ncbi:MAG: permease [Firmicutes bacterium HGW-Firmicutes-14]|nr:MAG: permease [Firmicutes bacterium HGW-Firmicutes-14]